MNLSDRLLDPLKQICHHHEKRHHETSNLIGSVVAVAAIVAFSYWIWPELRRTIRIHRM